jgi:hypothetical protein
MYHRPLGIAAAQRKSIQHLALERLSSLAGIIPKLALPPLDMQMPSAL